MKKEIRLLGIDDAPFAKRTRGKARVIGVLFRGGSFMDGCLSTEVRVDGSDATSRLIAMVGNCKWKSQLKAILLDGIAVGGFNVIDTKRLAEATGIPVIVVIRRRPDIGNIKRILNELGMAKKIRFLDDAGAVHGFRKVHFQCIGITPEAAMEILAVSTTHSDLPEPIRIAHIIGQGIVFGESKGRA